MEHIFITKLHDGYVKLQAEHPYKLFSITLQRVVSEAVVLEEKIGQFKAIE